MTATEIIDRLIKENVFQNVSIIQGELQWPDWAGKVKLVHDEHNRQSEDEMENLEYVYQLVDFGIYLMVNGVAEPVPFDEDDDDDPLGFRYENDDDNPKIWAYRIRETKPEVITRTVYY